MKWLKEIFLPLGISFIVLGLVLFSESVIPAATAAISVCINSVIPSLFPFFVCSKILLEYGVCEGIGKIIGKPFRNFFRLPEEFAGSFILGCLCGFPTGARTCAELYSKNRCTKRQAIVGAVLCNNAGPLFIIGTLGTALLNSAVLGRTLWFIHLLSAIVTAFILRIFLPPTKPYSVVCTPKKKRSFSEVFTSAVSESVTLILQICGIVLFFGAIINVFLRFGMPENGIAIGCIELTSGLIYETKESHRFLLPIASFLLGFGGLSVFLQVSIFFTPNHIPILPYIMGKTIQGGIAATLTCWYFKCFPITVETAAINKIQTEQLSALTVISLFLLLVYGCSRRFIQD